MRGLPITTDYSRGRHTPSTFNGMLSSFDSTTAKIKNNPGAYMRRGGPKPLRARYSYGRHGGACQSGYLIRPTQLISTAPQEPCSGNLHKPLACLLTENSTPSSLLPLPVFFPNSQRAFWKQEVPLWHVDSGISPLPTYSLETLRSAAGASIVKSQQTFIRVLQRVGQKCTPTEKAS
jgi:hypothetical protein